MRNLIYIAVLGCATVVVSPFSLGAIVYDSEGFEPPTFVPNVLLEGQDPVDGPWLKSGLNAGSTATVRPTPTIPVASGVQAVEAIRAGSEDGDARWGVPVIESFVFPPIILIDWDMRVPQAAGVQPFGPFFGVEAYDAFDNVPPSIRRAAAAGVDAKTGEVLFMNGINGLQPAGLATVAFDTWNHFQIRLDYDTDTYDVFLNNTQVVFGEPFEESGIDDFTDAPIAALAAGGDPDSLAASGTAYFDNYLIQIVPEPASLSLGLCGVTWLLARRRV